jgi:hypothetical protein
LQVVIGEGGGFSGGLGFKGDFAFGIVLVQDFDVGIEFQRPDGGLGRILFKFSHLLFELGHVFGDDEPAPQKQQNEDAQAANTSNGKTGETFFWVGRR